MADPATQFGQAGISMPQFTPVPLHLNPPIQLPGTGELWANVGRMALDAGRQMQASALNPEVREQMKYAVSQYKQGEQHIANMQQAGLSDVLAQTTPEGTTTMAPGAITDPTMAARVMALLNMGPKPGGAGSGAAPEVNAPAAPQGSTQDQGSQKATPETKGPPTTGQMGRPTTQVTPTSVFATNTTTQAPAPDQFGPNRPYLSASAEPGPIPTTAAGEPGYTSEPAAPQGMPVTQRGPVWNPLQPAPQGPQSHVAQAVADSQQQTDLTNWQNATQTEPMTADDAMKYIRRKTTLAQDATYLPHGGPNNEPAFAFHMKGGGINTIPLSQMVKDGAGPTVAAQNTSAVLSQSDRLKQQQQNAQIAALPQTSPVWNPQQPAPTGPQPPSAPGVTDIYGNPLSAYTNVASAGGPTIDQLTAQTAPAGEAAAVPRTAAQNTAAEQLAQTHPLWETVPQADQDTAKAQAAKMGSATGPYTGDRKVPGIPGPYTYYVNDDPGSTSRGRVYTTLPGPAGHYYDQKRWYLGTNQYEDYELPDSAAHQQLADKWVTSGYLTRAEADKLSPEQMEPWLRRAWENDHLVNVPIDHGTNLTLDAAEQSHKNLTQIRDMLQTLAANGYSDLGTADRMAAASENAGTSLRTKRPGFIYDVGRSVGGVMAEASGNMSPDVAATIRALDQKTNEEQELLKAHPGLLINPGTGGGQETPNIHGTAVNFELANIPQSTKLNDIAFSGQDLNTKLKALNGFQATLADRYNRLVDGQHTMLQRVYPQHDANSLKAVQGLDLPDADNLYRDHKFPSAMSPQEAIAKAQSSSTDQFPTVKAGDLGQFKLNHPGAYFYDENHNLLRVKPRQ